MRIVLLVDTFICDPPSTHTQSVRHDCCEGQTKQKYKNTKQNYQSLSTRSYIEMIFSPFIHLLNRPPLPRFTFTHIHSALLYICSTLRPSVHPPISKIENDHLSSSILQIDEFIFFYRL